MVRSKRNVTYKIIEIGMCFDVEQKFGELHMETVGEVLQTGGKIIPWIKNKMYL